MLSLLRSRVLGLLLVVVAGLVRTVPARAQEAENVAAARALGIQGVQAADAGNCSVAIEKLTRAESLYHAPTILGRLGECQVNVGQIVLGTENLNRVVREQLAPNAPKAFRDAQDRARKVLDTALPRIAHLTVIVEPRDVRASVSVSGVAVPAALIGVERPTDPGTHEVAATADGYLPTKSSVTLAEGGRETVTLKMTVDPNAKAPAAAGAATGATATTEPPPPPAEAKSAPNHTAAYVLLGVGGVGIVTGSITGVMALGKKSDLDCPDKQCSGTQADKLDSANTIALVSTISFGVGIAAAGIGTVLLLTSSGSSEKTENTPRTEPGLHARPFVGVGSVGLRGTF